MSKLKKMWGELRAEDRWVVTGALAFFGVGLLIICIAVPELPAIAIVMGGVYLISRDD